MGILFPRESTNYETRQWQQYAKTPALQRYLKQNPPSDFASLPRWAQHLVRHNYLPGNLFYLIDIDDARSYDLHFDMDCPLTSHSQTQIILEMLNQKGEVICNLGKNDAQAIFHELQPHYPAGQKLSFAELLSPQDDIVILTNKSFYEAETIDHLQRTGTTCIEMFLADVGGKFHLHPDFLLLLTLCCTFHAHLPSLTHSLSLYYLGFFNESTPERFNRQDQNIDMTKSHAQAFLDTSKLLATIALQHDNNHFLINEINELWMLELHMHMLDILPQEFGQVFAAGFSYMDLSTAIQPQELCAFINFLTLIFGNIDKKANDETIKLCFADIPRHLGTEPELLHKLMLYCAASIQHPQTPIIIQQQLAHMRNIGTPISNIQQYAGLFANPGQAAAAPSAHQPRF